MKSPSRVERGPKRKARASLPLLTVHTAHLLLPAVYYLMLLQFQLVIQAWSSNIQNELRVYLCASLLVFFLVFHLLTLAYHRQAAAPNLTKWVDLLPDWNVDQTFNAVFLWSLARKKILICKPQCWINAAFYPANFHILPQADILCMAQSSTCLLHCLRCCMKKSWALTWSENCCQSHCTVPSIGQHFPSCCAFMFSNPLHIMEISSVREACVIVAIVNCLCVCVHISNGTVVTRHISLMELQSSLLSLYASQASVCSRSNSTFVTLKLTLRGWDFYSSNQQSTSQTEQFTDSLEMLCWDSTMVWILPLS